MIEKWETIDSKEPINLKIFSATMYRRRNLKIKKEGNFVVLDSPLWVNIIPLTVNNEVVLVEQFRHGINDITLEVPGGLVETGEEPRIAAQRECTEETGFAGTGDAVLLGKSEPNPAFLNNFCYSYVWFDCKKVTEQALDGNEDINVITVPLQDIPEMILSGKINHSLVLDAFLFYILRYKNFGQ